MRPQGARAQVVSMQLFKLLVSLSKSASIWFGQVFYEARRAFSIVEPTRPFADIHAAG